MKTLCQYPLNHGNTGSGSVSIVARSRMSDASAASSGLKLSMSNEMSNDSPTQFAGGKKYSLSYVVFVVPGEFAPSPLLEIPKVCEACRFPVLYRRPECSEPVPLLS